MQDQGCLQADARMILTGNEKTAEVGRYIVLHRLKSNVVFVPKEDYMQTWGFKVRSSLEISKMTEIFRS